MITDHEFDWYKCCKCEEKVDAKDVYWDGDRNEYCGGCFTFEGDNPEAEEART